MSQKTHFTKKRIPVTFLPELQKATGKCTYPMTNDYFFRAILETNNLALKGLCSSLLHIEPKYIRSVKVTNPILMGDNFTAKEFHLDVNVLLNNNTIINLEMQVVYQSDWHERSLVYICRNLDSLTHGENYGDLKPAIHIGILDSAPAYEGDEFYSENMVMNVKTHKIYSDKFSLRVLRLDCIDNATPEDKKWKIDRWARLFKATTWEDIMTIAEHDKYLMTASNSLYLLNADKMARKRARDREDYLRDMQYYEDYKNRILDYENQVQNYENQVQNYENQVQDYEKTVSEQQALIAELRAQLAAQK